MIFRRRIQSSVDSMVGRYDDGALVVEVEVM